MVAEKIREQTPRAQTEKTQSDLDKLTKNIKALAQKCKDQAAQQLENEFALRPGVLHEAKDELERRYFALMKEVEEDLIAAINKYNERLGLIREGEYVSKDGKNKVIKITDKALDFAREETEEFFRMAVEAVKEKVRNRLLPYSVGKIQGQELQD